MHILSTLLNLFLLFFMLTSSFSLNLSCILSHSPSNPLLHIKLEYTIPFQRMKCHSYKFKQFCLVCFSIHFLNLKSQLFQIKFYVHRHHPIIIKYLLCNCFFCNLYFISFKFLLLNSSFLICLLFFNHSLCFAFVFPCFVSFMI